MDPDLKTNLVLDKCFLHGMKDQLWFNCYERVKLLLHVQTDSRKYRFLDCNGSLYHPVQYT